MLFSSLLNNSAGDLSLIVESSKEVVNEKQPSFNLKDINFDRSAQSISKLMSQGSSLLHRIGGDSLSVVGAANSELGNKVISHNSTHENADGDGAVTESGLEISNNRKSVISPTDKMGSHPEVTVEMCSGWAMIPIQSIMSLSSKSKLMKIPMSGGTPFLSVKITNKDLKIRPGIYNKLKRWMGVEVKSVLEILFTPLSGELLHKIIPQSLKLSPTDGDVSSPAAKSSVTTVGNSNVDVQSTMQHTLSGQPSMSGYTNDLVNVAINEPIQSISYYLPPNIVLPNKGSSIVAIYRLQLMNALKLCHDGPERVLPQSSLSAPIADVVLSSFPQFLADAAASRVLLFLWSKEAPFEIMKKSISAITTSEISNPKVLEVFRSVTHRLYRAYHCVDAQPDKLNPIENIEQIYSREQRIKNYASIMVAAATNSNVPGVISAEQPRASFTSSPHSATLSATSNLAGVTSHSRSAGTANSALTVPMVHTPFNTKELFWQQEKHF